MKSILIIFNFLCFNYLSAQEYFNKVIPSSEEYIETIYSSGQLNSRNEVGGFVLSKFRNKFGRILKHFKLDHLGNIIEFNNYLDSLNPLGIFALKKISYGFLTSGYQFRSTDSINHFWYAKLNDQFDTVWTKGLIKKYNNSSFNNIIELKSKNIALCGTDMKVRRNGTFLATIPVVAITDGLGNLLKYTEIRGIDTTGGEVFFGITEGLDRSIYAAGYIVKNDGLLDQDPIMAKVNSLGELQWRRQITNKGYNEQIISVLTQMNGSILGVGGAYSDYGARNEFSYLLLINFDTDGNINWTKRIFKGLFNDCYNVIQDKYGNIIGTGLYGQYSGLYADTSEGHGWIFKCNSTGDSIWSRKIIHANDSFPERFNNISQAPDGGFYLTGFSFLPGDYSSKAWIVKTDSFGCVVPGCEKIVATEDIKSGKEKAFVLFPNPIVSNKFYFLSRIQDAEPCQLVIYNLQGQVIQTYHFNAHVGTQYEVDLKSDIIAGYYVVQVQDSRGRVVQSEKMEVY